MGDTQTHVQKTGGGWDVRFDGDIPAAAWKLSSYFMDLDGRVVLLYIAERGRGGRFGWGGGFIVHSGGRLAYLCRRSL